jgi:hypothetical protein
VKYCVDKTVKPNTEWKKLHTEVVRGLCVLPLMLLKVTSGRQFWWTGHGVEWEKQEITSNSFGEEALERDWDSSVSISVSLVTRLLDNEELRVWVPAGARDCSLHRRIHAISRSYLSPSSVGTRSLSLCVKRLGSEAINTPEPGARDWNTLSCTSTNPYIIMAWCLIKLRNYIGMWLLRTPRLRLEELQHS